MRLSRSSGQSVSGYYGYQRQSPDKSGVCAASRSFGSACCIFFVPARRQCPQTSPDQFLEFVYGAVGGQRPAVCVARRRVVMSLGSWTSRRKARHAFGEGLNPVALIKSSGKLDGIAWLPPAASQGWWQRRKWYQEKDGR